MWDDESALLVSCLRLPTVHVRLLLLRPMDRLLLLGVATRPQITVGEDDSSLAFIRLVISIRLRYDQVVDP